MKPFTANHPRACPSTGVDDTFELATSGFPGNSLRRQFRRFPWLADLIIAAFYLLITISNDTIQTTGSAMLIQLFYVISMGTAVLLRRFWPLLFLGIAVCLPLLYQGTLVLVFPDSVISGTHVGLHFQYGKQSISQSIIPALDLLALCIAVLTVASERALRVSLPAVGLCLVIATTIIYLTASLKFFFSFTILVWLVLIVAYLIGSNIRSSRLRMLELENRARLLTLEQEQCQQLAVSQERNRIAREMHDVVSHSLSVMVALAEGAAATLDRNPEKAKKAVTELAQIGRESLQDTRRLVGVLRADATTNRLLPGQPSAAAEGDVPHEPQPGEHDVRRLIESYQRAGMPIRFHENGPELPPDPSFQLAIYRIVQESLTNVLRYARNSRQIEVTLSRSGRDIVVTIENAADDGQQVMPGSGKGVIGMRERAAVYDGTVQAGPTTTGWQVRAILLIPGQPHSWSSPV